MKETREEKAVRLHEAKRTRWRRSAFTSVWRGPDLELVVVQNSGSDESWSWTARGWREPDDCDGADKWGWVNTATRNDAENAALRFYMENDE